MLTRASTRMMTAYGVDGFTEDSMKDALERLKSAYEAGYIDKESLTNATSDCRTKVL